MVARISAIAALQGSARAFSSEVDPVRVKKTRQNKKLEPRSDSIGTEKALGCPQQERQREAPCGRTGPCCVSHSPACSQQHRPRTPLITQRDRSSWLCPMSRADRPTDAQARLFAEYLARDLKQSVFVENKGGAQGAIGAEAVAHGDPDGYTLLFTTSSVVEL